MFAIIINDTQKVITINNKKTIKYNDLFYLVTEYQYGIFFFSVNFVAFSNILFHTETS